MLMFTEPELYLLCPHMLQDFRNMKNTLGEETNKVSTGSINSQECPANIFFLI